MKPVLPARRPDHGHEGLGYPLRTMIVFATALALIVIGCMLPVGRGAAGLASATLGCVAIGLLTWHTHRLRRIRERSAQVLAALGAAAAEIPVRLRTCIPLVLVTGDGLSALFDRDGQARFAHVGDGAIWLRVDQAQALPHLAVAVRQWRDGRAPDGILLAVAPALYGDADALAQPLRMVRQATADAMRMLGTRMPGHVAVYQRLTSGPQNAAAQPRWYGVCASTGLTDPARFEPMILAAEAETMRADVDPLAAARAASLASIVGWTQRVVFDALRSPQQPARPWPLFGAIWIDCGPATPPITRADRADNPWLRDVQMQTCVAPASAGASATPWPLPQPLIEALPRRRAISPRLTALAHATVLVACAAAASFWASAANNAALLARIGADLRRYSAVSDTHDAAKRDALRALVADRDQIEQHLRTGIPLRLSFGLYRAARLKPALDAAIAAYAPPPAPPAVVSLDGMSLFDSGRAQLKPGSTRAMVGALDLIKAHPDKRILVAGHTDDVGRPDSNLALSTARARAVRDWLTDASGIPATQFAIQGYGDTRPIADNATPDGRARNRRVEITLVPEVAPRAASAP